MLNFKNNAIIPSVCKNNYFMKSAEIVTFTSAYIIALFLNLNIIISKFLLKKINEKRSFRRNYHLEKTYQKCQ